jgi:hypothetical protein
VHVYRSFDGCPLGQRTDPRRSSLQPEPAPPIGPSVATAAAICAPVQRRAFITTVLAAASTVS